MALDLNDKSGNSNTLTNVNTATEVTTNPPFTPDTSMADLELGSTQYFTAADSASLSITGSITIQGWVNQESATAADDIMAVAGKNDTLGVARSYVFGIADTGGTQQLQWRDSADGVTGNTKSVTWSHSQATWYHIAAVHDASATEVKFYVNGAQQGSTQTGAVSSRPNSTTLLYVGAAGLNSGGALFGLFDGIIDEVRIYNVARTEAAIAADYQAEISTFTNVAAYYPFNAIPSGGSPKRLGLLGVGS